MATVGQKGQHRDQPFHLNSVLLQVVQFQSGLLMPVQVGHYGVHIRYVAITDVYELITTHITLDEKNKPIPVGKVLLRQLMNVPLLY